MPSAAVRPRRRRRRSVLSGLGYWSVAQRPRQTRGAEPQSVPLAFYNSTPEAANLALLGIGACSSPTQTSTATSTSRPLGALGLLVGLALARHRSKTPAAHTRLTTRTTPERAMS